MCFKNIILGIIFIILPINAYASSWVEGNKATAAKFDKITARIMADGSIFEKKNKFGVLDNIF